MAGSLAAAAAAVAAVAVVVVVVVVCWHIVVPTVSDWSCVFTIRAYAGVGLRFNLANICREIFAFASLRFA